MRNTDIGINLRDMWKSQDSDDMAISKRDTKNSGRIEDEW